MTWWQELEPNDILVPTDQPRPPLSVDASLLPHIGSDGLRWTHALATELAREYVDGGVPELSRSADFTRGLQMSTEANVLGLLRALISGGDHIETAQEALAFIDEAARRRVPMIAMLRGHQIGVQHWLRWCAPAIARHTDNAEQRAAALEQAVSVGVRFVDRISEQMIDEYERELQRRATSGAERRSAMVAAILAENIVDTAEASRILSYPLRGNHMAISLRGRANTSVQVDELEDTVQTFAAAVGARSVLTSATGLTTMDAWLAEPDTTRPPPATVGDCVDLGVGTVSSGMPGFVLSVRQAHRAMEVLQAVAPQESGRVIYFDRVRLASLMIDDLESTRSFIRDTLGPLAGPSERASELRGTLQAFFDADKSYVAVARSTHLHKNTVVQRIAKASEFAGRNVSAGIDVYVALTLIDLLGPE
ncbi:PucR family transcriptional regulator [Rhodococcus sovatensis]|uniref:Helix-turn-helix domain-containing protein n=1 Tax=Rhodococcus sovatensis TaxID=1805840 RepID=A0ABZ2PKK6_9NOCA